MRTLTIFLGLLLLGTLYRVWLSDDGLREVWRLREAVDTQATENAELSLRNSVLDAQVQDLKEGLDAVEENARSELGMTREGETFYQVIPVDRDPPP
ncbi:MAG: septum formation initiator family protein [Pseudomonadota bacterium]